jgi:hypothetical protein
MYLYLNNNETSYIVEMLISSTKMITLHVAFFLEQIIS